MVKTLGTKAPKKEEIGKLTNVTTTDSAIHGTGWLVYSIQNRIVKTSEVTSIEKRIIEIQ